LQAVNEDKEGEFNVKRLLSTIIGVLLITVISFESSLS